MLDIFELGGVFLGVLPDADECDNIADILDNLILISCMAHMICVVALKHRKHEQNVAKYESVSSSDEENDDEEDDESIGLEQCAAVVNVATEFSFEEWLFLFTSSWKTMRI